MWFLCYCQPFSQTNTKRVAISFRISFLSSPLKICSRRKRVRSPWEWSEKLAVVEERKEQEVVCFCPNKLLEQTEWSRIDQSAGGAVKTIWLKWIDVQANEEENFDIYSYEDRPRRSSGLQLWDIKEGTVNLFTNRWNELWN